MCMNSLRLATDFKRRNALSRVEFVQMNLFRPCFPDGEFDLVISNGVLHHTSNPWLAFETISRLVKPGGYVLVGLYHRYGRLATDVRRRIFDMTGDRMRWLDRRWAASGQGGLVWPVLVARGGRAFLTRPGALVMYVGSAPN